MTQRSYSELVTLFPDNTSGLISPQDLRDFLESVRPPWGSLSINTPAATTIAVPGTYYKAAGTSVVGASYLMTANTSCRLTYSGVAPRHFHMVASISSTCASNNQIIGMQIAKNGTPIEASLLRKKIGTGSDIVSTALHGDAMLSTDDYMELFITNETSTASVTVQELYMFAMGMIT